jgi:hypothetical protein
MQMNRLAEVKAIESAENSGHYPIAVDLQSVEQQRSCSILHSQNIPPRNPQKAAERIKGSTFSSNRRAFSRRSPAMPSF